MSPVDCQATAEAGLSWGGGSLGIRYTICWAGPFLWDVALQCFGKDQLGGVIGVMGFLTRKGVKQVQGPSREKQKQMEPETNSHSSGKIWMLKSKLNGAPGP